MVTALASDLDEILEESADDLRSLRGTRVLVTGASGFVGRWLTETLTWAHDRMDLGLRLELLCRNPGALGRRLVSHPCVRLTAADVRTLAPEALGHVDAVIHTATAASAALNAQRPTEMIDTIVDGTRRVLAVARHSGSVPFLFTSSGAVYGPLPPTIEAVAEDYRGGPDPLDPGYAYHEAKRMAELLCSIAAREHATAVKVARLFAFVGPHLPIDAHFAVGNFMRDRIGGQPINVLGDGTTVRSYLYAGDMTAWLLAVLVRGETARAYNVGSQEAVAIESLAEMVAASGPDGPVPVRVARVAAPGAPVDRYVPSTERIRTELGVRERVGLDEGLARTLAWHRRGTASS